MYNIIKAKNEAVKELEQILVDCGWQDGYGLGQSYFNRDNLKPLFFRNSAPALSNTFKVEIQGQSRIIYIIYNVISATPQTANNMQYKKGTPIDIAIDIWYDDAFNFNEDESDDTTVDDIYMDFGSEFINLLVKKLWVITDNGEVPEESETTITDYLNRNSLIVSKKF